MLNLIKVMFNINAEPETSNNDGLTKEDVLTQYNGILKGICCLPRESHIKLRPDAQPVIDAPSKVPIALK